MNFNLLQCGEIFYLNFFFFCDFLLWNGLQLRIPSKAKKEGKKNNNGNIVNHNDGLETTTYQR